MTAGRLRSQPHTVILDAALVLFFSTMGGVLHDAVPMLPLASVDAKSQADTYQDVYQGWKWWHVYCYRCHGTNAVATTLAPDLIDPNRKLTSAQFLKIVRNGVADKGMQAWNKLLDDKQIGQIHLYVRARTDRVLPPGRPDEIGPSGGAWAPPQGWPKR